MPRTLTVEERESLAMSDKIHLEAAEGVDTSSVAGFENAQYAEPGIEGQWIIAYKMHVDNDGEYGMPHPVPQGELMGGSKLLTLRRQDGGPAWRLVKPARVSSGGDIECVAERCGDAHIGGRRKHLKTMEQLIRHVETFHPEDFQTYRKYFDQIADQLAVQNPRLMRLMEMAGISGAAAVIETTTAFFCPDDECTQSFGTQKELDAHARSHR